MTILRKIYQNKLSNLKNSQRAR
ncbi:hypothetical protein EMIT0P265_180015 [Pseudomonas zeae]